MNTTRMLQTALLALTVTLGAAYLSGCADYGGGGYYGGPDVDVGVGFGYYDDGWCCAGGWGRGYRVGPWHGDHHWDNRNSYRGRGTTHSYRAAPAGRAVPSIPSRGHSGGGHSGPHHH